MKQKLIQEIGRSQRLQILNTLKRTQGLSVREMAGKLSMSYMGVKGHCIGLEKTGYLDTWRRPKPIGRPEMVYRLTRRAHDLFPSDSNEMTLQLLESVRQLYGPAAPEKLLFSVFQRKGDFYLSRLKGNDLAERARWLSRVRDAEGYMSECIREPGVQIVEHHSPMLDLLQRFPIIGRLEREMFERILQSPVRREDTFVSGLFRCIFHIDSESVVSAAA